MKALLEKKAKL